MNIKPNPNLVQDLHPSLRECFVYLPDPSALTCEQIEELFPNRLAPLREIAALAQTNTPNLTAKHSIPTTDAVKSA